MIGPLFVFEITPRCNLECPYCYNVWKKHNALSQTELPLDRIEILADSISAAHPLSVTLTGGEPLMRVDLPGIVEAFRSRGILVGIATNGLLLDRNAAESLKKAGASWFEISLPSVSEGGYRELTGVDGFQAAKTAMLAAKAAGAGLTVSHIITSENYLDSGLVVDLACAFSAESVALNRFVPGGTGLRNMHLLPSPAQLDSALCSASRRSLKAPGMTVYTAIPVENCLLSISNYPGIKFGTCICGKGKWAVNPAGDLRVCEQSHHVLGSLFESSFEELSLSPYADQFRRNNRCSDCSNCSSFAECGGGCRFLQVIPNG